jgi:hypothetical protein
MANVLAMAAASSGRERY